MINSNTNHKTLNLGAYAGGRIVLTPKASLESEAGGSPVELTIVPSSLRLEVLLSASRESGAAHLPLATSVSGRAVVVSDADGTITISVAGLMAGVSRIEVRTKFGTQTKVIYSADLVVKDGASGYKTTALDSADVLVQQSMVQSGATNQRKAFPTYAAMVEYLNDASAETLSVSADILIWGRGFVDKPDFWISSVAETSVPYTFVDDDTLLDDMAAGEGRLQIGYYFISELEPTTYGLETETLKFTDEDEVDREITFVVIADE